MAKEKPMRIYRCSEAELYAVCQIGWRNYLECVSDFANWSTTYDAAYGNEAMAEVMAAQQMPDLQARNGVPEMLRIKLKQERKNALRVWNGLRRHINRGWAAELVKPQEDAAGLGYYKRAHNDGWDELQQLLVAGKKFIELHNATLLAGGMPAGFEATYNSVKNNFETLYLQFKDGQQDMKEQRNTKIDANNMIMKKLNAMFADGQLIYAFDAAKRKRFMFKRLLELVSIK
jgi:hypothetical protein